MSEKRIDILRNLIADIGKEQIEYHKFFPAFADKLVVGLGRYLGDEDSIALTTNEPDFQWDKTYRQQGLGFEGVRYRIPIMIKFDNILDSGYVCKRIWLFCSKRNNSILISINNEPDFEIQENELDLLYTKIHKYLFGYFSKRNWFEIDRDDYKSTDIGFLANE
ncbi:MAG: hypothetical protein HQ595_04545 [Candidatus Omnitrophica bacterium]|nr:hypothetical protein [Candidatus Omnitrophota bacterium]